MEMLVRVQFEGQEKFIEIKNNLNETKQRFKMLVDNETCTLKPTAIGLV